MTEPEFEFSIASGPTPVPARKPYVEMCISCSIPGAGDHTGSMVRNLGLVRMRRLWATIESFENSGDMFRINRNLWVTGCGYNGSISFTCRYYMDRPLPPDDAGSRIIEGLKNFINSLKLKPDPKAHVGFELTESIERLYIPYLLGVADPPDME